MWYKIAELIEDIDPNPDDDDIKEVIITLHELELKEHLLNTLPEFQNIHPKRKARISGILTDLASSYFEVSKNYIEKVFKDWEMQHQTQSADDFADMVIEEMRETVSSYDEQIIEHCLKYGLERGSLKVEPEELTKHGDKENAANVLREDYGNDPSSFEYMEKQFLDQRDMSWDEDGDLTAREYIEQNGLEDEAEEYIVGNYDLTSYASELGIFTIDDLRNAIKETLYEDYRANFGGSIDTVHEEVAESVARMESSSRTSVSEMATAVSLALNVMHVFGNIMLDYGRDITGEFLGLLGNLNGETEEWKQEMFKDFLR